MTTTLAAPVAGLVTDAVDADGPGVAVGVYQDGALSFSAVRGLASLEYGAPIGPRTRFDLASLSKQMTGACALLLHREGVVDLDADLRRWVPELRLGGITVRGCLHHTTGLRDYEEVNPLQGGSLGDMASLPQFLAWLTSVDAGNFPPGSDVSYSNTGYVAVATALSRAAGMTFAELMHERVFSPLGMEDTVLHDTIGRVVPEMAFSYLPTETVGYLRQEMAEELVGDGAVLSSLEDLAGWHGFLLDGRGLGPDVRHALVEPAVLLDGRRTRYGCGVARRTLDGQSVLAHSGSMYAFRSYLASVPALGLGVTVLSNHGGIDAGSLALDVLRRCLPGPAAGRPAAVPPRDPPEDHAWFCPSTGETVVSRARPDGTFDLATGYSTAAFVRDGAASWQSEDGVLRVESGPTGELCVEDGLGRIRRYLPTGASPAADPVELVGSYSCAELGDPFVDTRGGTVQLVIGRRRRRLEWLASFEGDDVYRAPGREPLWLRRHADDGSITVSTGNTVFPRLPRAAAPPASANGPVTPRAGCCGEPPIPR